jgi:cardiolipin synthase A/B
MQPTVAHMLPGNRVTLLHDGEVCLPAMKAAIDAAEREILLEMYWFGSDATGRSFAELLIEKARQGLRVSVVYDSVGSWEADRSMFDEMRAAGCEVHEYNPLRFWKPQWRIGNRRNHRKQLVVDGRLGMTGGVNLADPWAAAAYGGHAFHDDLIQIEGPAVGTMRGILATSWQRASGLSPIEPLPPPAACGDSRVAVLVNDRRRNRRLIERAYLAAIRNARSRVLIENSYFIPNLLVRHALAKAVRRGVDVRVLLPYESDVPAVAHATRRLYSTLLAHGIRLHEWGGSVLHSKTAVIDDWCTVGTHNLDYRSWIYNLEINVSVQDSAVAAQLAARIERDMAQAVPVDGHAWRFRPLRDRLLQELFYRFRRLL